MRRLFALADGIIVLLKPPGISSQRAASRVKRFLGQPRVGHAGTLDPDACGVLVLCLGRATRLTRFISSQTKRYRCELLLGARSDTQDSSAKELCLVDASWVDEPALAAVLPQFQGEIEQIPPMFSALKHQGQRLYQLARQGLMVERPPRKVSILDLRLLYFRPGPQPQALLEVACSEGTYLRALCADIGAALGCGGLMSFLVRTAVGPFSLEQAITLEELEQKAAAGKIEEAVLPASAAVEHLPGLSLSWEICHRLSHGAQVPLAEPPAAVGQEVRVHSPSGELVAIAAVGRGQKGHCLEPRIVLFSVSENSL